MKNVSCIVLSIGLLLSTNIFPSEGGLWAVVVSWPGCIVGTVASCCCLKRCIDAKKERDKKDRIKRKYNERTFLNKVGEFIGAIKYDHSTGGWESTNVKFPDPPRPKRMVQVQEINSVTGRPEIRYRLQ